MSNKSNELDPGLRPLFLYQCERCKRVYTNPARGPTRWTRLHAQLVPKEADALLTEIPECPKGFDDDCIQISTEA
jgi:hypothetical protein